MLIRVSLMEDKRTSIEIIINEVEKLSEGRITNNSAATGGTTLYNYKSYHNCIVISLKGTEIWLSSNDLDLYTFDYDLNVLGLFTEEIQNLKEWKN